ncbi:type IV secretory system conjugative DNA transfer family protein [Paracoccus sp. SY]|uniref:type IV secretory system conjugative DNA transfer family protein n=1 Tax=Paracoccus sp. SY TaxID=1330255 RepID=UPI000CD11D61|nr:type IV secretory system conjugative DNA transfer family protein [Paracoccus sp. SY]
MASDTMAIRLRVAGGVLLISAFATAIGYVVATGVVQYWFGHPEPDFLWLIRNYFALQDHQPNRWVIVNIIIGGFLCAGLLIASRIVQEQLTRFGTTHWMTERELKRKNFFGDARTGFVLAKTTVPTRKGRYIVSGRYPHCLLVAPTGSGKGVGFVIPNLLSYKGSAVVLDVKGENFEATARFREKMGQTIYRFSPRDFDEPSFRYNPLDRIKTYTNPAKRMAELEKIATLFLQAEDSSAASFLPNSRAVFVACGILAYEQGELTLGRIHKLANGGGDFNAKFKAYAGIVKDRSARLIFQQMAGMNEKTLTSYISILNSAGMSAWSNPHTCAVTDASDFDFSTFRKKPQTVYLTTPFNEIGAIAPLIRLFFADLIATLQDHEPRRDEPFPVLILMDEFQRIGRMPVVAESISLLRSYGGNLAIVTQTIPDLDVVYGEQVRKTLQGGAGIKLYLTPSEPDTIAELSDAVGMTTKRVVSRSKNIKDGLFSNNISERTEEHPLLTRDQARRLPREDVVIVVDGDMPIRAKRLMYYDDTAYKELYESQNFDAPLPQPPHTITEADYTYLETAEDTAEQKAEAKAEGDAARSRAAEKRDKEAESSGQGQFDFEEAKPSADHAGGAGTQPATQDGSPDPAPTGGPDQIVPVATATSPQEATEGTEAAPKEADRHGVSDQSNGQADTNPVPIAGKAVSLSGGNELIRKAALLRRRNQERQLALPLPEVNHSTAEVSLESATLAHLRIDKLTTTISETLSAAS